MLIYYRFCFVNCLKSDHSQSFRIEVQTALTYSDFLFELYIILVSHLDYTYISFQTKILHNS